ncbi:MAG: amino acid adenylation domain-containing protein [Lewinellaceae bacterium]|nr:amino acid adenylation domain-containing protein [Lewinellaceae bacterium]
MKSILDLLFQRSVETPDRKVFTFLEGGDLPAGSLTFRELDDRSGQLAGSLAKIIAPGDRVLLLFPEGLEFITTFFACLKCGAIAVPCNVPTKRERLFRTRSILSSAEPALILGPQDLLESDRPLDFLAGFEHIKTAAPDQIGMAGEQPLPAPAVDNDTIAYLQYTSGSTGNPKGTIVTHGNIMDNLAAFQATFQHTESSVAVSWLPFFHDMGLVYGLLQPVYSGYHGYLMPPLSFVQNPARWLRAISRYKGTHAVAPNFGYELCCTLPEEQKKDLDLSSWVVAINGSEFIRASTLEQFTAAFGPYGWKDSAFCPGYGLAEATLMVTALAKGLRPTVLDGQMVPRDKNAAVRPEWESSGQVVGCGYLNEFTDVRIVDPATGKTVGDGGLGEIWVAGKNVSPGYWNNPAATAAVFGAKIKGIDRSYLKTGDLGFVHNGQLYVTGRIKELIILNGQNFYPTDLEQIIETSHSAISSNGVCAFSFAQGEKEKVGVACEIKRTAVKNLDPAEVLKTIRSRIIEEFGVRISALYLVKPRVLPRTTSGKIMRLESGTGFRSGKIDCIFTWEDPLELQDTGHQPANSSAAADSGKIRTWLMEQVAEICSVPDVSADEPFSFYGMDSALAARLAQKLTGKLGRPVSPTLFYNYPTAAALAEKLTADGFQDENTAVQTRIPEKDHQEPVAIVGMGCRFPGANDTDEFWDLLQNGVCATGKIPDDRWKISGNRAAAGFGGTVKDIDLFDPLFFGISPREAVNIDPQQRLLLEVAWESLQDAGILTASLKGSNTGVYIGISSNDYAAVSIGPESSPQAVTGIALSIAANRISYLLDLKGPAIAIDTACSSSLVAVHRAVKDLQSGEIDTAIVGGVNVLLNPHISLVFEKAGMLSPTGRCNTFDAGANGYVRSEGCGAVILKRSADAIRENCNIHALIRGTAVNQDGKTNGITAPNGLSQARVIKTAQAGAGVPPGDIDLFEAHGTGTPLGDPIEVNALKTVLAENTNEPSTCWLTSVKANIGHLEAAAGIAGLIKAVLCLKHRTAPPQVNYSRLNPEIDLTDSRLDIPVQKTALPANRPLFAGVSSFGFGGTNAHVVIETPPAAAAPVERRKTDREALVLLSARSEAAIGQLVQRYLAGRDKLREAGLRALSLNTIFCRDISKVTLGIAARDFADLEKALRSYPETGNGQSFLIRQMSGNPAKTVWVFSGQGSQFEGMGRELYDSIPEFRVTIDECAGILKQYSFDLPDCLFGPSAERINQTRFAQPGIFAIEYSLAKLMLGWGMTPDAIIGHSIGEYAAACISGILKLEDALRMLCLRGALMQGMEPGEMTAVFAHEKQLEGILPELRSQAEIAAYNSDACVVLSGESAAMAELRSFCDREGLRFKALNVSHAFHSPMTESILEPFRDGIGEVNFGAPRIPILSTLTGTAVGEEMGDINYWIRHIREPVRFREVVQKAADQYGVFIELGPKSNLQGTLNANLPEGTLILPALTGKGTDRKDLLLLAGKLTALQPANPVNWSKVTGDSAAFPRIKLPFMPYEKDRYWISSEPERTMSGNGRKQENDQPGTTTVQPTMDSILELASAVLHIPVESIDPETPLTGLGADSIMLLELVRKINSRFGVEISVRQLFGETGNLRQLADYVSSRAIPETPAPAPHPEIRENAALRTVPNGGDSTWSDLFSRQLDLIDRTLQKQFELLGAPAVERGSARLRENKPEAQASAQVDPRYSATANKLSEERQLTASQQRYFDALQLRYAQKTKSSKLHAGAARKHHADWLYSIDFRLATKEFLYPIVFKHAFEGRFTDIDDNEYIDIGMGYGVNFFGNSPRFIRDALAGALDQGQEIAAQHSMAAQVSEAVCRLTGHDRVTFTNSGTEAVMTAIRMARAVTGRNKIVLFNGCYHGTFDGYLAQADAEGDGVIPLSPGTPDAMIRDVILLDYGQPAAIEKIRALGDDLAAVLVEPVQSRKPDGYDPHFLQELRAVTTECNIVLIFDEIITGFRVHPGGVQAVAGIRADLTTYGKVIGGGMPIGMIAGKSVVMDAIDGGPWDFGDQSYPRSVKTFFGGTFCKHPLTLAAAKAVADKLLEEGPSLQERVNRLTGEMAEELNRFFRSLNVPLKVVRYGSLFRFKSEGRYNMLLRPIELDIFFYSLMEKGVYTWERRVCFLSTAHSQADIRELMQKVRETVLDMLAAGFFPEANSVQPGESSTSRFPLTPVQKQLFILSGINAGASTACNLRMTLKIDGALDESRLEAAVRRLADRHEALRIRFDQSGEFQEILPAIRIPFRSAAGSHEDGTLPKLIEEETNRPFDVEEGPLFRVTLLKAGPQTNYLILTAHHLIADGWSMGVIAKDLGDIYRIGGDGNETALNRPVPFSRHLNKVLAPGHAEAIRKDIAFWQEKIGSRRPTAMPGTKIRARDLGFAAQRIRERLPAAVYRPLTDLGRKAGCTSFMTLYGAFTFLIYRLGGERQFLIGVPTAGRAMDTGQFMVGSCADMLPVLNELDPESGWLSYLQRVKTALPESYEHQTGTFASYQEETGSAGGNALRISFNLDANIQLPEIPGLETELDFSPVLNTQFDLVFDLSIIGDELQIECDYRTAYLEEDFVRQFLALYKEALIRLAAEPELPLKDVNLFDLGSVSGKNTGSDQEVTADEPVQPLLQLIDKKSAGPAGQRPALVSVERSLTFLDLEERSDSFARLLIQRFELPENGVVAAIYDPSPEWAVAMLGVWKAGGVFLPVDNSLAEADLAFLLDTAKPHCLLLHSARFAQIPQNPGLRLIALNTQVENLPKSGGTPLRSVHPDKPALMTLNRQRRGKERSFRAVSHHMLSRSATDFIGVVGAEEQSLFLVLPSGRMNRSVYEICSVLAAGMGVFFPDRAALNPGSLEKLIAEHQITGLSLPSVFLPSLDISLCPSVKRVVIWGEPPGKEHVRSLLQTEAIQLSYGLDSPEVFGSITLRNMAEADLSADWISIAGSSAGRRLKVVDRDLNILPAGIRGELAVTGPWLPGENTNESAENAFVLTGILAKWTSGGMLQYLGEQQNQFAADGLQINLQEIKNSILDHPGVRNAVVVWSGADEAQNQPVAFYSVRKKAPGHKSNGSPHQGDDLPVERLRSFLKKQLPAGFIPEKIYRVDHIPVLTDLLSPEKQGPALAATRAHTTDDLIEQQITDIWKEVLGLDQIQPDQVFFEIGGHSLKGMQVCFRIKEKLGGEIGLAGLIEHPTIRELTSLIKNRAEQAESGNTAAPAEEPDLLVSPAQQRLWTLDKIEEGSHYNLFGAFQLEGALNFPALEQSLNALLVRHESLRTTFALKEGRLIQQIRPVSAIYFKLTVLDLADHAAQAEELGHHLATEERRRFDLADGPLFVAGVIRLGAEKHVLYFNIHHIAADAWSLNLMLNELSVLYNASVAGGNNPLAPLEWQYKDFAARQRREIDSGALEPHRRYWASRLEEGIPRLNLPTDCLVRPSGRTYDGAVAALALDRGLCEKLYTCGKESRITPFMILAAGVAALLNRYTHSARITMGAPVLGRHRRELENQVGFFVNLVLLVMDVDDQAGFESLLSHSRETLLGALAHQDYPFDLLVEEFEKERDPSYSPLFDVYVSLNDNLQAELSLKGLSAGRLPTPQTTSKYDLSFNFEESNAGDISLEIEYDTRLFGPEKISRLLGHFEKLLELCLADPQKPLWQHEYLKEEEKILLLEKFHGKYADIPENVSLPGLFSRMAAEMGDRIAVEDEAIRITYAEFDRYTDRLAHFLRLKKGVRKGDRVIIAAEPGYRMTAGLMAILKAGGGYVPVDPEYPEERVRQIFDACRPVAVLSDSDRHACLNTLEVTVIPGINDEGLAGAFTGEMEPVGLAGEDLAYIIFTSGSTGVPKGVAISHRNVFNTINWMWETLGFDRDDIVLQKTSFTFDVSVWEFFLTLCFGARLVCCPKRFWYDMEGLHRYMIEKGVTSISYVPSALVVYQDFVSRQKTSAAVPLKRIIAAGEALKPQVAAMHHSMWPVLLYNLYGPTEATVYASIYLTRPGDATIPIGVPVYNSELLVLDRYRRLCPLGVQGEIAIGGAGLSSGYYNAPELTERVFIDHPYRPGEKLYLTGDVGKLEPDGNMIYMGRKDHQIKLRGFRIELGEIETALARHEKVQEAVVLLKEGESPFLAGYILSESDVTPAELKSFLNSQLPAYMVPSAFIVMDSFPRTGSGKIDRKTLVRQGNLPAENKPEPNGPVNATESRVLAIWKAVLGLEAIDREHHFFEIGGQSLKGIQICLNLESEFGIPVTFRDLVAHPRISALAEWIGGVKKTSAPAFTASDPRPADYPASLAQERLWTLLQIEEDLPAFNIFGAFELLGPLNTEGLTKSLKRIVERHESLRTNFELKSGKLIQVIRDAGSSGFEVLCDDLTNGREIDKEVSEIIMREQLYTFDLAHEPLFRAGVIKTGQDAHLLFFNLHHIIADEWSLDVITGELIRFYNAYLHNEEPGLPEPERQYKDFALRQRIEIEEGLAESHRAYWKDRLSGKSPRLTLPVDIPEKPTEKSYRGSAYALDFDRQKSAGIYAFCQTEGLTPFMLLAAGTAALLSPYAQEGDPVMLGTSVLGRNQKELQDQVGYYINLLPLRIDVDRDQGFRSLACRTREILLDGLSHQDYPFHLMVKETAPDRDLASSPLFDVYISWNNRPEDDLRLENLRIQPLKTAPLTGKYDLSFNFSEHDGRISLEIIYDPVLFRPDSVKAIADRFDRLMAECLVDPERPLGSLQSTGKTNAGKMPAVSRLSSLVPNGPALMEMLEARAGQKPDQEAVVSEAGTRTFRELHRDANRLAHFLLRNGLRKNDLALLLLEDSPGSAVVAILAVLKAGGAYVPLDPALPPERMHSIVQDTGAGIIITDRPDILDKVPAGRPIRVIDIRAEWPVISQESPMRPQQAFHPEDLAYIIYTSGSTGTPKGVMITHGNLADYLTGLDSAINIRRWRSFGLMSTMTADLGNTVLFGSLVTGGTIHLFSKDNLSDPPFLHDYFRKHEIDCIKIVPAHWKALEFGQRILLPGKAIIFGGEELTGDILRRIRQASGKEIQVFNHYGPTEATIGKLVFPVDLTQAYDSAPIGKPFGHTVCYIVDEQGEICGAGVPGELWIGGKGIAAGYWNRPELTGQKFIDNPFEDEAAGKLYRTGDLVCMLEDGQVVFRGRMDDQVKLNGFRIELKEVELALRSHEKVGEAIVLLRKDPAPALAAFVLTNEPISSDDLRDHLRQKLPDYMIPGEIRILERFPLNSNGKIDRKALLALPVLARPGGEFRRPETDLQRRIAAIWKELLGHDRFGIEEKFFAVGGDSIKVIRLVALIRDTLGLKLRARTVFRHQTIEQLATYFQTESTTEEERHNDPGRDIDLFRQNLEAIDPALTGLKAGDWEDYYPMSDIQLGMIYHYQEENEDRLYHQQTFFQFRTKNPDLDRLKESLGILVRRHPILRTSFHLSDFSMPLQIVHHSVDIPSKIHFEDYQHLDSRARNKHILEYLERERREQPFDLSQPGLFRMTVFQVAPSEFGVVWSFHHAILDGWSNHAFLAELRRAYLGEETSPAPASLYRDYVFDQRRIASDKTYFDFWAGEMAGFRPSPAPFAKTGSDAEGEGCDYYAFSIPKSLHQAVRQIAARSGAGLKAVYLAAFCRLLSRTGNPEKTGFGLLTHGRLEEADGDKVLGCFLNSVPFGVDLAPAENPRALIRKVSDKLAELSGFDALSLVKILKTAPEKDHRAKHPFEVLFAYFDFPVAGHPTDDLALVASRIGGYSMTDTPFDFMVYNKGDHANVGIFYRTASIDRADIRQAGNLYREILARFAAESGAPALEITPSKESEKAGSTAAPEANEVRSGSTVTPLEQTMTAIWEKVLSNRIGEIGALEAWDPAKTTARSISATDNFFTLGGDSILAMQLSIRIQKELGLAVKPKDVFNHPTIEGLCRYAMRDLPAVTEIPVREEQAFYPASPAQQRFYILQEMSEDKTRYNLRGALITDGPLDYQDLNAAFGQLIERQESLRTAFHAVDGEVMIRVVNPETIQLPVVFRDFSNLADPEHAALQEANTNGLFEFDLSRPPLIHLEIIRITPLKHLLIFNIHHIISDEWSMHILVGEIGEIYRSIRSGLPAAMPPLRVQYKDFTAWLTQELFARRATLKAYWEGRFPKGVPQLNLPTDFPRPGLRSSAGIEIRTQLPVELTAQITGILEAERSTLFVFFTTAVVFFLSKLCKQERIVVGTPVSGRVHPDTENLIGLFINTLLIDAKVDPDSGFSELLHAVGKAAEGAQDHQLYPFDELVADMLETREEGRNPLFDVWVVYHNAEINAEAHEKLAGDIAMNPVDDNITLNRYDLKFDFVKTKSGVQFIFESSKDLFTERRTRLLFEGFMACIRYLAGHFDQQPSSFQLPETDPVRNDAPHNDKPLIKKTSRRRAE